MEKNSSAPNLEKINKNKNENKQKRKKKKENLEKISFHEGAGYRWR